MEPLREEDGIGKGKVFQRKGDRHVKRRHECWEWGRHTAGGRLLQLQLRLRLLLRLRKRPGIAGNLFLLLWSLWSRLKLIKTHTHTEQTVLQEEEEKEAIKNEDDEEKPNRQSNVLLRRRKIEATTVSSSSSRNSFQFGQPKYSAQSLPVRRGRTRGGGRQRPLLFSVFESLALSLSDCVFCF